jgi:hypothetical protein
VGYDRKCSYKFNPTGSGEAEGGNPMTRLFLFFGLCLSSLYAGIGSVPLTLRDGSASTRTNDWVTTGVPLPQGTGVTNAANLMVTDSTPTTVDSMLTVLARWGGAPSDATKEIKWVLCDFRASVASGSTAVYYLTDRAGSDPGNSPTVVITSDATYYTVNTGTGGITAKIRRDKFTLLDSVVLNSNSATIVSAGGASDFHVTAGGVTYSSANATAYSATVEYPGNAQSAGAAMRGQVHVKGTFSDGTNPKCLFDVRLLFYAGSPVVKVQATYVLDQDAFVFKPSDLSLSLPLNLGTPLTFTSGATSFSLNGTTDYGYYVQSDYNAYAIYKNTSSQFSGTTKSATDSSWVDVSDGSNGMTVSLRDMWQNFPNEIEMNGATLNTHLWPVHADLATEVAAKIAGSPPLGHYFPYQPSNLMDLTAAYTSAGTKHDIPITNAIGISKTWELMYYFHGATGDSAGASARFRNFLLGTNAQYFCDSLTLEPCQPYNTADTFAGISGTVVEGKVDTAFTATTTAQSNYNAFSLIDYGDYQFMPSPTDRYWHQGDEGWFFFPLMQFVRTADLRADSRKFFDYAYAAVAHNADVDRQHVDRTAFIDANGTSIARVKGACTGSVSSGVAHWYSVPDLYGGNFSHCRINGIAAMYFLTGYGRAYDVAMERINAMHTWYAQPGAYTSAPFGYPDFRAIGHLDAFTWEMDLTGSSTDADTFWAHYSTWDISSSGSMPDPGMGPGYDIFGTSYGIEPVYQYAFRKNDPAVTAIAQKVYRGMLGMGQTTNPVSSGTRAGHSEQPSAVGAYCWALTSDVSCRNYLWRYFREAVLNPYLGQYSTGINEAIKWIDRIPLAMRALKGFSAFSEPLYPVTFVKMPAASAPLTYIARKAGDVAFMVTFAIECDGSNYAVNTVWKACSAITIDVKLPTGYTVSAVGYPQTFTPISGTLNSIIPFGGVDTRYHTFTIPADGLTGDYQIIFTQTGATGVQQMALAAASVSQVWLSLPAGGVSADSGEYYFNIADTTPFTITGATGYGTNLFAPDGNLYTINGTLTRTPTVTQIGLWKYVWHTDEAVLPLPFNLSSGVSRDVSFSAATNPQSAPVAPVAPVAPTISTSSPLPDGQVGSIYTSVQFYAAGDTPITWTATGVPSGLALSSGGLLSGTPLGPAGIANISVTATNAGGTQAGAPTIFLLTVDPKPMPSANRVPAGARVPAGVRR